MISKDKLVPVYDVPDDGDRGGLEASQEGLELVTARGASVMTLFLPRLQTDRCVIFLSSGCALFQLMSG